MEDKERGGEGRGRKERWGERRGWQGRGEGREEKGRGKGRKEKKRTLISMSHKFIKTQNGIMVLSTKTKFIQLAKENTEENLWSLRVGKDSSGST